MATRGDDSRPNSTLMNRLVAHLALLPACLPQAAHMEVRVCLAAWTDLHNRGYDTGELLLFQSLRFIRGRRGAISDEIKRPRVARTLLRRYAEEAGADQRRAGTPRQHN